MHYGVYLSSIGEYADPKLLAELTYESEAEGWDGVVAICGPGEDRAIRPDEVSAIKAYMQQHRASRDHFDIVVILWSESNHSAEEQQTTTQYAEAGVTWWLEDASTERFSLEEARARIHKGPPG
jgi:hypothetical protein